MDVRFIRWLLEHNAPVEELHLELAEFKVKGTEVVERGAPLTEDESLAVRGWLGFNLDHATDARATLPLLKEEWARRKTQTPSSGKV